MGIVIRAIDVGFGNTKYVTATANGKVEYAHFPSQAYFSQDEVPAEDMGGKRRTVQVPVQMPIDRHQTVHGRCCLERLAEFRNSRGRLGRRA